MIIWAQMVGDSIRGACIPGLTREQAGERIEEIIRENFGGQRLQIGVRLPESAPQPLIPDHQQSALPPMVD